MVRQKEIVLLPFPFTNLETTKVRPALVISNNSFNDGQDDCVALPLTSVIKENKFSLKLEENNLKSG